MRGRPRNSSGGATARGLADERSGFSLVEVMITMALVATLAAIATPLLMDYRDDALVAHAAIQVAALSLDIERYKEVNGGYPDTLAEAGVGGVLDPWGNAYRFKKIVGMNGNAGVRKDQFLVPLNSDFDLYSIGKDGLTAFPLSPPASHDDVIRANDGAYVGLAEDY